MNNQIRLEINNARCGCRDREREREGGRVPIVGERSSKEEEMKETRRLLLPTPESPINKILNDRS